MTRRVAAKQIKDKRLRWRLRLTRVDPVRPCIFEYVFPVPSENDGLGCAVAEPVKKEVKNAGCVEAAAGV
jgi:hypothetical protein